MHSPALVLRKQIECALKLNIERDIRSLKRGLMSDDLKITLPAYRSLYEAGSAVLPTLDHELYQIDLRKDQPKEALRLFTGLAALQRDIDETASDRFIDQCLSQPCTPIFAAGMHALRRQSQVNFRRSRFGAIDVYESSEVNEGYRATEKVAGWLQDLPVEDVSGIDRIYILASWENSESLGSYMPIVAVITVVWQQHFPASSRLASWLDFTHRWVLFHEIGHHTHRHTFGQDPEQEREADLYSNRHTWGKLPWWFKVLSGIMRRSGVCRQFEQGGR